jgi:non-specific serine/threonine protein kinase/serine/threonine-protein kinase
MEAERWRQIEQLYYSVLEREESKREEFLQQVCAGDRDLRGEVESLLAHKDRAEAFMDAPAFQVAAKVLVHEQAAAEGMPPNEGFAPARTAGAVDNALIGKRVGPYRLVELIGSGGMGAVYRAERDDNQFEKQIAVKLLRFGSQHGDLPRRFRDERQILARLEHPNIARLLDAGATDDGLPYFMMEYVEGRPIHRYCDERGLTTRERLNLFQIVCSAVQYAHQNLVIHRDIKPGNILVTDEGVPKLLDFGIAKLIDPASADSSLETTATTGLVMTPEYASPEQVRGEAVSTSTDVYSLGVLLYELLTGQKPYIFKKRLPSEIAKVVCESEPVKPSLAVTCLNEGASSLRRQSARRNVTKELQRNLAGDLDNIVLTAIRKDPRRRYASVEQFSTDIRGHLEGFPVVAHKDTPGYRAGKFIERHRAAAATATLALVMVIGGILAIAREARVANIQRAKAEQRFNDVRKLANSFMFDVENEIQGLPGSTHAQEKLVKTALQYLDSLTNESKNDPSLQRELAAAYQRVGDIEGGRGIQNLGNTSAALENYQKALKIREGLAEMFPDDAHTRNQLAMIHASVSTALELRNDIAGALKHDYKELELYETSSRAKPNDRATLNNLSAAYADVGRHLMMQANWTEALGNDLKALAIFERLAAAVPADKSAQQNLATQYNQVAYELNKAGDRAKALEYSERARAIDEDLASSHPHDIRAQLDLCSTYQYQANLLYDAGDFEKSLRVWSKALVIARSAAASDAKDSRAKLILASVLNSLGWLLVKASKTTDIEYVLEGLEIRRNLYAAEPTNPRRRDTVANSYAQLGETEAILAASARIPPAKRIAHWKEARSWYQRALEIYTDLKAKGTLRGKDSGEPDRIVREIAKCDAALGKAKIDLVSPTAVEAAGR